MSYIPAQIVSFDPTAEIIVAASVVLTAIGLAIKRILEGVGSAKAGEARLVEARARMREAEAQAAVLMASVGVRRVEAEAELPSAAMAEDLNEAALALRPVATRAAPVVTA